jgi:hypothetical protein
MHVAPIARKLPSAAADILGVQAIDLCAPSAADAAAEGEARARFSISDKTKAAAYGFEVISEFVPVQDGCDNEFALLLGCLSQVDCRDGDVVMEKMRTTNSGGDGTECTNKVRLQLRQSLIELPDCRNGSEAWLGHKAIAPTERTSRTAATTVDASL